MSLLPKQINKYSMGFIVQSTTIFARFIVFSFFLKGGDANNIFYANLAFGNAILPFLLCGTIFAQNGLYTRFINDAKKTNYVTYFESFVIVFGIFVAVQFLAPLNAGSSHPFQISLVIVCYNMVLVQLRARDIVRSNYLHALETTVLIVLVFVISFNSLIFATSIFYVIILATFILLELRNKGIKSIKLPAWIFINNLRILFYGFPTFMKDFVDVIILGMIGSDTDKMVYAFVILLTAPAKIFFGLAYQIINKFLSDTNLYYYDIFPKNKIALGILFVILFSTFSALLAVTLGLDFTYQIFALIVIRCVGIVSGANLRSSFLDNIQKEEFNFRFGTILPASLALFALLLVAYYIFGSLYLLATFPLIYVVLFTRQYKINEKGLLL